jgi:hypothetical protein
MFLIRFLLISIVLNIAAAQGQSNFIYREELQVFKESSDFKRLFNEDADPAILQIQRDIENLKRLTTFQQLTCSFSHLEAVVVTVEKMPKLYSYIQQLCDAHNVAMPIIFLSNAKGFFNAAAQKILKSTGAIVIGSKLINETSDEVLEAIIAHEIGHIKHNHVNKRLAIHLAVNAAVLG